MDWKTIRAHYARLFEAAKLNGEVQESIAGRGGLRQNKISKILSNHKKGPSVDVFVRAVEGLGLTLSAFFAQIETGHTSSTRTQPVPLQPRQVTGVDSVPETAAAIQALALSNADIAETLKQIAEKGIPAPKKPRGQTARAGTKKAALSKVRGKAS